MWLRAADAPGGVGVVAAGGESRGVRGGVGVSVVIAIRPDSDAHRVLAALVARDRTAAQLADALTPRPALLSSASYPAWAADVRAWEAGREARTARVSRLVGRLVEAGYVEPRGPARIADGVPDPLTPEYVAACRRGAATARHLSRVGEWYTPGGVVAPLPGDVALDIVARLRAGESVRVVCASGHAGEVYAELCALDIVVPPSVRRATAAGVALVGRLAGVRVPVSEWHRWAA